ncbi:hypothetical protein Q5P01_022941 [Channa striata]|uniref:Uncharacterized protein n=1 Tax=Channa striata TaxID=64152 RepID=A0AA88RWE2_CHASR|nr:hypothetical protein Q5P01_022941 [Channa striata]
MTSVRQLREFVTDRLTAAAEEIFREFEKTIAEYQDEIERQRRLLDVVWKPEVKLRRIELLLQQDSKDEEVPTQQQLCNQERNSNLDQEEPEPPQIKREQVELRSSQDVEELFPGQWTETSKIKLPCDVAFKSQIKPCSIELQQLHVYKEEELFYDQQFCNQEKNPHLDQEEPEPPQIKDEQKELCGSQEQEQEQLVLRQGTETFMMIPPHQESDRRKPEQSRDHQFFSPSSAVVENQDQKGSQRVESGSTRNTEPEPKKKCYKNTAEVNNDSARINVELVEEGLSCKAAAMTSVRQLREFVTDRLTAAAEEIFREFEKTIAEYQDEIERQRRLLDVVWKPEVQLHRVVLPHQHVCKEDALTDQQLCDQERNFSLDQEEPSQIKKEEEEVCSSHEGEQLVLKQEIETCMCPNGRYEIDGL